MYLNQIAVDKASISVDVKAFHLDNQNVLINYQLNHLPFLSGKDRLCAFLYIDMKTKFSVIF